MLRTAVLALSLAACTTNAPNDATLNIGTDSQTGNVELQFTRADSSSELGALTASINGITIDSPVVVPGGCASTNNDPLGGGCAGPYATWEISPTAFADAVAADVTVTEAGETFHFAAPEFFVPRAITVQTSLGQPLVAGDAVVVTDGAAGDQLSGFLMAYTPDVSCFTVDASGAGSLRFLLDPTDFDASCARVPAGTIANAQLKLSLRPGPAQTCDGPANLTCGQSISLSDTTVAVQLQF